MRQRPAFTALRCAVCAGQGSRGCEKERRAARVESRAREDQGASPTHHLSQRHLACACASRFACESCSVGGSWGRPPHSLLPFRMGQLRDLKRQKAESLEKLEHHRAEQLAMYEQRLEKEMSELQQKSDKPVCACLPLKRCPVFLVLSRWMRRSGWVHRSCGAVPQHVFLRPRGACVVGICDTSARFFSLPGSLKRSEAVAKPCMSSSCVHTKTAARR